MLTPLKFLQIYRRIKKPIGFHVIQPSYYTYFGRHWPSIRLSKFAFRILLFSSLVKSMALHLKYNTLPSNDDSLVQIGWIRASGSREKGLSHVLSFHCIAMPPKGLAVHFKGEKRGCFVPKQGATMKNWEWEERVKHLKYSGGSTYGSAPLPNHSCVFLFIF